jgi:mRNA interferase RelE/StbE
VAPYSLSIKPSAVKELRALPKRELGRIVARVQSLAAEPRPSGCEKLSAETPAVLYRVRQGDYRVVYAIDDEQRSVVVVKVGHRREVYR